MQLPLPVTRDEENEIVVRRLRKAQPAFDVIQLHAEVAYKHRYALRWIVMGDDERTYWLGPDLAKYDR